MPDYQSYTDPELTTMLKQGNGQAYAEIFERYKEVLFRHAYRMLQDRDRAEDIVQDIFMILWEKREKLPTMSSLSAYLYSSVRNRIFNQLAHQKVVDRYVDSIKDFFNQGRYTTDELVREKELAAIIEKEVAALPKRTREVFRLRKEESRSYKEIAEQLDISERTAKQQLYKAVKVLKLKINSILSFMLFL